MLVLLRLEHRIIAVGSFSGSERLNRRQKLLQVQLTLLAPSSQADKILKVFGTGCLVLLIPGCDFLTRNETLPLLVKGSEQVGSVERLMAGEHFTVGFDTSVCVEHEL